MAVHGAKRLSPLLIVRCVKRPTGDLPHDGRLEGVPGVGKRRAAAGRATLDNMLKRVRPTEHVPLWPIRNHQSVAVLVKVDRKYRRKAEAGGPRTIAPKRFNPEGKAWLSVLHSRRKGRIPSGRPLTSYSFSSQLSTSGKPALPG